MHTIRELIDLYEHGDPATGWQGVRALYPAKAGRRHSEADNMLYALRGLAETEVDLVAGHAAATQSGLFQAHRRLCDLTLDDLRPGDFEHVQRCMAGSGLSRSSINARMGRIRRWIRKWAIKYEYCGGEVRGRIESIDALRRGAPGVKEKPRVRSVDEAWVKRTAACCGFNTARAIEVQRLTGMRPGELVSMRVCDLHASRDAEGRVDSWLYLPGSHKTEHHDATRAVPLGPQAVVALRAVIEARFSQGELECEGFRFPRLGDVHDDRLIWPWGQRRGACAPGTSGAGGGASGGGFDLSSAVKSYRDAVARAAERAGVPRWFPNQLRHSVGTQAAKVAGEDVAAQVLGHSDPRTTRKHYIDPDRSGAKQWALDFG